MSTAQAVRMTNDAAGPESGNSQVSADTEQYLTFILNSEEYGVDILRVQEIKGWDSATPIPNTPNYVRGVINLRGTIVPIIDLRARFGLERVPYGPTTVVSASATTGCGLRWLRTSMRTRYLPGLVALARK